MLLSEYIIGRSTQKEAVTAYKLLAPHNLRWSWIGKLGVIGCFIMLSFYSVVGGWIFIYSGVSLVGGVIEPNANPGDFFNYVIGTPWITLLGLALFTLANVLVIALGVQNGIEKANKVMMPLLFILFIILNKRYGKRDEYRLYQFYHLLLFALGQSFFALAVGFSCLVTYSSYLKKEVSIPQSATWVVVLTILVSFLAGLAIFPVVFTFGMEPTEGPGLLFMVLPAAFSQMAFGEVFLAMFLILFLFATLTSSFSMYEIIVAALIEKLHIRRTKLTVILGIIGFIVSIPSALSFNVLSNVSIFNKSIFDATDYLVSNVLLPLGNILIAIFIVYVMDKQLTKKELLQGSQMGEGYYHVYRALMTYVVPVVIIIVCLARLFGF